MVHSGLLVAASKTNSSSGSIYFILIIFAAVYFFYLRPRRAKMLAQRAGTQTPPVEIQAGDTVVMTSGIIGRVLSIDGDRATVEIAPDTGIEIQRTALGRRVDPDAPDESERWASLTESASGPDAPTEIVHDEPENKSDDDEHPGGTP